MCNFDRLKVIVAGDSGVGKTAFVHLVCYGEVLLNPSWTVGCSLELSIFSTTSSGQPRGGSHEERYFVEYWDVGGSVSHEKTRQVFYDNIHGVILVHDLTNKKSETNLSKWLAEITSKNGMFEVICQTAPNERTGGLNTGFKSPGQALVFPPASITSLPITSPTSSTQQMSLHSVITPPVLVVGTKLDQVRSRCLSRTPSASYLPSWSESSYRPGSFSSSRSFAASRGFPEITLNCNSSDSFGENTYNTNALSAFLQQVVRFKRNNEGVGVKRDPMNDYSSSAVQLASLSGHDGGSMTNQFNLPYGRSFGGDVSYKMPSY